MITCPWCGTNYQTFQPNCKNCGGPLPHVSGFQTGAGATQAVTLPPPPPAPRPVADSYAWKLMFQEADGIVGLVFAILGSTFLCTGFPLLFTMSTILIGLVFLPLALGMVAISGFLLYRRYQKSLVTVRVLQLGQAAQGEITSLEKNYNVRVNRRHPWVIRYRFHLLGRDYEGHVTTLATPGPSLQPGQSTCVLYLPEAPENNALYPHP